MMPDPMETYRINEIFYSLQGEGAYTGTPMVFVRFSGCNVKCPFCDTDHSSYTEMTAQQIRDEISQYPSRSVCLTGGEPTLQVTDDLIRQAFAGCEVHIETNGSRPIPSLVDWVTVSPKALPVVADRIDELKLVFGPGMDAPEQWADTPAKYHFLQPMAVEGDPEATQHNTDATIDYIKAHPLWRLSLQTHKITHIR